AAVAAGGRGHHQLARLQHRRAGRVAAGRGDPAGRREPLPSRRVTLGPAKAATCRASPRGPSGDDPIVRLCHHPPPPPAPPPAVPRRAATLVLLRDGETGVEVLMLRRVDRVDDRSSGAYVFPGGTLDAADRDAHAVCAGLDDAQASARLSLPEHGLDYVVA